MEEQDDEAAEIEANVELLEFTVNLFKNLQRWSRIHRITSDLFDRL
jgi:hypothetical protein